MNIKYSFLFLFASSLLLSCNRQQPPNNAEDTEAAQLVPVDVETGDYQNISRAAIDTADYLVAVGNEGMPYELGAPFAFVSQQGDTIIPFGKYEVTFTDTLKSYAIVSDASKGMVGIDRMGRILFDAFVFDNGPDYMHEGLFRVKRNGKIGFANQYGEVVIPCRFECAYSFEEGKAKVAEVCTQENDGEHSHWESEAWFMIDRTGKKVE